MFKLEEADGDPDRAASLLIELATALDCSIEAFSKPTSFDSAETAELVRLWLMIQHGQDRLKVLSFIRNIASEAAAQ